MQITVIGAASIDIIAKSKDKIVSDISNPADINLRAGGEARNIASMLSHRGVEVSLITAVGDDALGALLRDSCNDIGINTDAWIIKSGTNTCTGLIAYDNDGTPHTQMNAMTVPELIRTGEITRHKSLIKNADLLVLDLNLTEKILSAILDMRSGKPVLVDAVSNEKAKRIGNLLEAVDVIKLNREQAESLSGITLDTKERVKQACYSIAARGAGRVFVTLGMAGVCAADKNTAIFVPAHPVAARDVVGAGDAFTAGLAMSMTKDLRAQAEQAVTFAHEHLKRFV
ncbi:MAG: PfkB family carbohydrate kinase [Oscillospiraceae bacterium]|nr:PfkB family carbohydrate kinase [Oscillospiraceae bacterium]